MSNRTILNSPIEKQKFEGGPEWTLNIRNVTIERFIRRLTSEYLDAPYSCPPDRKIIGTRLDKLDNDDISIVWKLNAKSAESSVLVKMKITRYSDSGLVVVLKRRSPLEANQPTYAIAEGELSELTTEFDDQSLEGIQWADDKQDFCLMWDAKGSKWLNKDLDVGLTRLGLVDDGIGWKSDIYELIDDQLSMKCNLEFHSDVEWRPDSIQRLTEVQAQKINVPKSSIVDTRLKRFAVCLPGVMYYIPWTLQHERIVVNGRELVSSLRRWLETNFDAEQRSIPSPRLLKLLEDQELQSHILKPYWTVEGQRIWEERERAKANAKSDKLDALALSIKPADQGEPRSPTKRKGGRRSPSYNQWANEQIINDENEREVYLSWLQKRMEETGENPEITLSDPWDSFRKATKSARRIRDANQDAEETRRN